MTTSFAQAIAPLRALGTTAFLTLTTKISVLAPGRHALTLVDWSALPREQRSHFTECLAMPLFEEHGRDWHARLTPVAIVGGEQHPVADFDEQCDGILLLDLAAGSETTCPVVFFPSPDGMRTYPVAATVAGLAISAT